MECDHLPVNFPLDLQSASDSLVLLAVVVDEGAVGREEFTRVGPGTGVMLGSVLACKQRVIRNVKSNNIDIISLPPAHDEDL